MNSKYVARGQYQKQIRINIVDGDMKNSVLGVVATELLDQQSMFATTNVIRILRYSRLSYRVTGVDGMASMSVGILIHEAEFVQSVAPAFIMKLPDTPQFVIPDLIKFTESYGPSQLVLNNSSDGDNTDSGHSSNVTNPVALTPSTSTSSSASASTVTSTPVTTPSTTSPEVTQQELDHEARLAWDNFFECMSPDRYQLVPDLKRLAPCVEVHLRQVERLREFTTLPIVAGIIRSWYNPEFDCDPTDVNSMRQSIRNFFVDAPKYFETAGLVPIERDTETRINVITCNKVHSDVYFGKHSSLSLRSRAYSSVVRALRVNCDIGVLLGRKHLWS